MTTNSDSGCAVPINDISLMRAEVRITELERDIARINNVIDVLTDRLLDDERLIDAQRDEIADLKERMQNSRTGKTLAERILHYFLTETDERSLRSSDIRRIFGVSRRATVLDAMRHATELSSDVSVVMFRSHTGSELALIKNNNR